tara:strand:+ start:2376 stop:2597 length:222 start_codon:yes stop_codon:yes gene_type:complete
MFGMGIPELLIILSIVLLLFGSKRLKTLGSDLGSTIKGFRKAVADESSDEIVIQKQSSEEPNEGAEQPKNTEN